MRVLLSRFVIAAAAPPLCGKCHFASAVRTLALGSGCPGSAALRLSGRGCCEGTAFMEATVAILPLWLRRDPICHWRTSFQPRPPQFGALWIAVASVAVDVALQRGCRYPRPRQAGLSLRNLPGGSGRRSCVALRNAGVRGVWALALRQRLPRLRRMATSGCVCRQMNCCTKAAAGRCGIEHFRLVCPQGASFTTAETAAARLYVANVRTRLSLGNSLYGRGRRSFATADDGVRC